MSQPLVAWDGHDLREVLPTVDTPLSPRRTRPPDVVEERMPTLEMVRADVEKRRKCRLQTLEPMAWKEMLPNLFFYSFWKPPEEVPKDLTEEAVFALRLWIKILLTIPLQDTYYVLGVLDSPIEDEDEDGIEHWENMVNMTRSNLSTYLIDPDMHLPAEALEHIGLVLERHQARLKRSNSPLVNTPWVDCIGLYSRYADALVMTGQFNAETRRIIEGIIETTALPSFAKVDDIEVLFTNARLNLVLVLQQMGIEPAKRKMITDWAIGFLRKRPHFKPFIHAYMKSRSQFNHPIADALGPAWFGERQLTTREEMRKRQHCSHCLGKPPLKTLSRCSGCGQVYYCSRVCQKAHWKDHKAVCRSTRDFKQGTTAVDAATPDSELNLRSSYLNWLSGSHYTNEDAVIFALGLHRDPSRGLTHILVRQVDLAPGNHDKLPLAARFRVTACSVFRIADVKHELPILGMGSEAGSGDTGEAIIDEAVASMQRMYADDSYGTAVVPFTQITLSSERISNTGRFGHAHINTAGIRLSSVRAMEEKYDPEWRKVIFDGMRPAGHIFLPSGAKDAEHDF